MPVHGVAKSQIYIYTIYMCVCVYIYIYREREREREKEHICKTRTEHLNIKVAYVD